LSHLHPDYRARTWAPQVAPILQQALGLRDRWLQAEMSRQWRAVGRGHLENRLDELIGQLKPVSEEQKLA
jgi:hypothetical protein